MTLLINGEDIVIRDDDPTFHQLRLLLTLADECHFGRAAARLHLTQPALSQQIRSLERRLGVQLFSRSSRRVELTPGGEALLPLAKNVVEAMRDLRSAARQPGLGSTSLTLGVAENAAALAATRFVVSMINELHPHLDVVIRVVDFVEQASLLEMGEVDAALVYLPLPAGLQIEPLVSEPRVACISRSYPLAERESVYLGELAGYPMVGLNSGVPGFARRFWSVDPRPDGSPVSFSRHGATKCEELLSAVSFDGAIAFVPAVTEQLYPRPDIRYLPVCDLTPCTLCLAWPDAGRNPQGEVLEDVRRRLRRQQLPSGTMAVSSGTVTPSSSVCT